MQTLVTTSVPAFYLRNSPCEGPALEKSCIHRCALDRLLSAALNAAPHIRSVLSFSTYPIQLHRLVSSCKNL